MKLEVGAAHQIFRRARNTVWAQDQYWLGGGAPDCWPPPEIRVRALPCVYFLLWALGWVFWDCNPSHVLTFISYSLFRTQNLSFTVLTLPLVSQLEYFRFLFHWPCDPEKVVISSFLNFYLEILELSLFLFFPCRSTTPRPVGITSPSQSGREYFFPQISVWSHVLRFGDMNGTMKFISIIRNRPFLPFV